MKTSSALGLLLPLLILLLLSAASLLTGSMNIAPAEAWDVLTGNATDGDAVSFILLETRLPRLLTAVLSGAALAVAGLLMQTVFANPLADPSLLGVNSGAGLGVAVAMLWLGGTAQAGGFVLSGYLLAVSSAFIGAGLVILLLLACSALLRGHFALLIAGVMLSFIVSSAISLLNFYATAQGVQSYIIWGLGDFGSVTSERMPAYALTIAIGLLMAWALSKPLNALLLGADYATNLGIRVRAVRTATLLVTGLLTAAVTALCGPISFIGLAVPHAARLTLRTSNHRLLLPASMLWGADTALLCNVVAHLPGDGGILPLNAITPLLGAPVVLYIIFSRKHIA